MGRLVWLDNGTYDKLAGLKQDLGFRSFGATVNDLMLRASGRAQGPPASFDSVFADPRPCLIVGPSGSGKTMTTKALMARFQGPTVVITPTNEYADLEPLSYGSVAGFDWSRTGRFAIPLSADLAISRVEGGLVFRQLNLVMPSGAASRWAVVVEEAHRFEADPELKALILEARKYLAKLLVLTADATPFANLAPAFTPQPRP